MVGEIGFTAVQARDFAYQREPQARTLLAAGGARQRVETVEDLRQGVVRSTAAMIANRYLGALIATLQGDFDVSSGRRKGDRVVEQVEQRLLQQKRVATHAERLADGERAAQPAGLQRQAPLVDATLQQLAEVNLDCVFRCLQLLDPRQHQHSLDDPLQAARLLANTERKTTPIVVGRAAFEDFGRADDGRERALHFMRQVLHVTFDVLLAFEAFAHQRQRACQLGELTAAGGRRVGLAAFGDLAGVDPQAVDRPAQPGREHRPDQCRSGQQDVAGAFHALFGVADVGQDAGQRLGHREYAEQPPLVTNRCGHVHHRRAGVVGLRARAAGAVFALEHARHVAPLRIIGAQGQTLGVEDHPTQVVGDVDAKVDAVLLYAPDACLRRTLARRRQSPGELAIGDPAAGEIRRCQFGEDMRRIDQGFFGGLADSRLGLAHEDVEHEPRCQADDQEIADEQANGNVHRRPA